MKIAKYSLDYRSTQVLLNRQISEINTFLADKTLIKFALDDEAIFLFYDEVTISPPPKIGVEIIPVTANITSGQRITLEARNIIDVDYKEHALVYHYE